MYNNYILIISIVKVIKLMDLKNNGKTFAIKWSIIKRAQAYTQGRSRCNLCTKEKLQIIKSKSDDLLNKQNELFSKCCHRNRFSAWNFKRRDSVSKQNVYK